MRPNSPQVGLRPVVSRISVYERVLADAKSAAERALREAEDRLATPEEIRPIQATLDSLDAMRTDLGPLFTVRKGVA